MGAAIDAAGAGADGDWANAGTLLASAAQGSRGRIRA